MKKSMILFLLSIMIIFSFAGCNNTTTVSEEYYDYAFIGLYDIYGLLNGSKIALSTVYSGCEVTDSFIFNSILDYHIALINPDLNSFYHEKKSKEEIIAKLESLDLPRTIVTTAKYSITAYCYVDINKNLWAVFVSDVTNY